MQDVDAELLLDKQGDSLLVTDVVRIRYGLGDDVPSGPSPDPLELSFSSSSLLSVLFSGCFGCVGCCGSCGGVDTCCWICSCFGCGGYCCL